MVFCVVFKLNNKDNKFDFFNRMGDPSQHQVVTSVTICLDENSADGFDVEELIIENATTPWSVEQ